MPIHVHEWSKSSFTPHLSTAAISGAAPHLLQVGPRKAAVLN
jgi:hypothetical protein